MTTGCHNTLSDGLKRLRLDFRKTLVFCCTLANCSTLYQLLQAKLGKEFTEPIGYPDLHQFRMVEMFTRTSTKEMKEKVLKSFIDVQSQKSEQMSNWSGVNWEGAIPLYHLGVLHHKTKCELNDLTTRREAAPSVITMEA